MTLLTLFTLASLAHYISATYGVPLVASNRLGPINDHDNRLVIEGERPHSQRPSKDIIDLSFYGNALYGVPDHELTAARVSNYTSNSGINPEELGTYLEGDILFPISANEAANGNGRSTVTTLTSRWPGGIVPFEINGYFSAFDGDMIAQALRAFHDYTCIRFVPHTYEADYISIESDNSGCWSSVGRLGGKQVVNLQSRSCLGQLGTPVHELMHALGFLHEQCRDDRDRFVEIHYENIKREDWGNFEKAESSQSYDVAYDYGSVMHYSAHAFSNNRKPSIVPLLPELAQRMGQRDGFSAFDVEKLNRMYCSDRDLAAAFPGLLPQVGPGGYPEPEAGGSLVESFLGGFIEGLINGRRRNATF